MGKFLTFLFSVGLVFVGFLFAILSLLMGLGFFTALINFVVFVGAGMVLLFVGLFGFGDDEEACPFCRKNISVKASVCPFCQKTMKELK